MERNSSGHVAQQAKTFKRDEINTILTDAGDNVYLSVKVYET